MECVKALVLCHNVTPVVEEMEESGEGGDGEGVNVDEEVVIFQNKNDPPSLRRISYQASSPDEVTNIHVCTVKISLVKKVSQLVCCLVGSFVGENFHKLLIIEIFANTISADCRSHLHVATLHSVIHTQKATEAQH